MRGWRWWLVLVLVLLAAFALRLYRLDHQDIWWDEARNIDVASRPLGQIAISGELDIHPPVYFYLLHGWWGLGRHTTTPVGQDAFAIRFLSLWFGVLFVALMYALGRRVGGRWTGLGAALGAAYLPFLLGEAQEARMYTVLLVWLAAAGLAMLRASGSVGDGPQSATNKVGMWLLCALFSALALLTHYAAVFALAALWGCAGIWALVGGSSGLWRRVRTWLLTGLVTGLLCLPVLPIALRQIPSYRNPNLVVPSVKAYLAELAHVYSLGEHMEIAAAQPWMWALAALLVGGWLVGMANWRINESVNHDAPHATPFAIRHSPFAYSLFVTLWSLLPLIVYYLVIMDRSTFATRYIAGALPGWLLLAGLAVTGWARLGQVGGGVAALALVAILTPGLIGDLTDPRFFREDTRGMVAWLREETDPKGDLILVDQRYPFGLYWSRWNSSAEGSPPVVPADLAPAQYLFVDINTVADRLAALARGRERVFLVRWFESDTDPRGAAQWLLEKFGTQLGERSWRGYRVTWYVVPPEADFELAPGLIKMPAEFGDQVRLEGFAFGGRGRGITSTVVETRAPLAPADGPIWVLAQWSRLPGAIEPGKALPRGLKATLVLEDTNGVVVGRDDRPILNDRHLAPLAWLATDQPLGVYMARAASASPPGTYTVKLAVYDPVTLTQLPVSGRQVAALGSFVTLGQVTLTRPVRAARVEALPIESSYSLVWQGLRLLGRGPLPAEIAPGDRLTFDLFWQAEQSNLPDVRAQFKLTPLTPTAADVLSEDAARSEALRDARWEVALVNDYATNTWQAGDVVRGRQQLRLDPGFLVGAYQLTLSLSEVLRDARTNAVGGMGAAAATSPSIVLGEVIVAGRPHVFEPPPQLGQPSGARFGDLATLLGYDLVAPAMRGEPVAVTLYWRAEMASTIPYAVSVQLLDANGRLRAQRDQQPGDGTLPTTGWVPGEVLTDVYRVAVSTDLPAGAYDVIVKLYDAATGVPLAVQDTMSKDASRSKDAARSDFLRLMTIRVP